MDNTLEKSLLERIHQGDQEAFGQLYDVWLPKIYAFIYYRVHHRETAQDITATVFLKAFEAIGRFDSEKGTVGAWLYRIARNAVTDHWRASRPQTDIDDVWNLHDGTDIVRDADCRLKIEAVNEHMQKLTAEQREIVVMRVWDGLSYAEIAATLGRSEASCKMAYSRGVHRLRESMPLMLFISFLINKI